MMDKKKSTGTVSETAALAIYRELTSLDGQLQAQVSYVHSAAQQIATATMLVNELYAKRSELARELGRVAPEEFGAVLPTAGMPMAPINRFHKPHPLPHGALAPMSAGALTQPSNVPTPPWGGEPPLSPEWDR